MKALWRIWRYAIIMVGTSFLFAGVCFWLAYYWKSPTIYLTGIAMSNVITALFVSKEYKNLARRGQGKG